MTATDLRETNARCGSTSASPGSRRRLLPAGRLAVLESAVTAVLLIASRAHAEMDRAPAGADLAGACLFASPPVASDSMPDEPWRSRGGQTDQWRRWKMRILALTTTLPPGRPLAPTAATRSPPPLHPGARAGNIFTVIDFARAHGAAQGTFRDGDHRRHPARLRGSPRYRSLRTSTPPASSSGCRHPGPTRFPSPS